MLRRTAIALAAAVVLLASMLIAPLAQANPDKPTVTVTVPPKASHEEIIARVRLATKGQTGWMKIDLKVDSTITETIQLEKASVASLEATPTMTTTLNWDRPAVSSYITATSFDLNPTLSYSVEGGNAILEAFSWIQYRDLNAPNWDSYADFDYFSGRISSGGTITMHLPLYKALPGREQEARFDAVLRYDGDPYNFLNEAHAVFSTTSSKVFLANISN